MLVQAAARMRLINGGHVPVYRAPKIYPRCQRGQEGDTRVSEQCQAVYK